MRKLILLGAVMALAVSALTSVAGAEAPPPLTAAEVEQVRDAEVGYWTGDDAKVEADFGSKVTDAAKLRYEFQNGQTGDYGFWFDLLGRENVGHITIEDDGSVTIEYKGKKPDVAKLPAKFKYQLVPVDKNLAELNPVDELSAGQPGTVDLTDPFVPHNMVRGGQTITVSCNDEEYGVNKGLPFYRPAGYSYHGVATATADVTWIQNGARVFGVMTVGHAFDGTRSCYKPPLTGSNDPTDKHWDTHLWTGHQGFPLEIPALDPLVFDDSVTYWNSEGTLANGGRSNGGRLGIWENTSSVDAAIIKRNAPSSLGQAHLGPWRYGYGTSPYASEHGIKYGKVLEYPILNATYCTSRTMLNNHGPSVKNGVDCGAIEYLGPNLYGLDVSSGVQGIGGESGSPVFSLHANPRLVGMVVHDGTYGHEFEVQRLWHALVALENSQLIKHVNALEVCGVLGVGTGNPPDITDRTYPCG